MTSKIVAIETDHPSHKIKPIRWFALGAYCMLAFSNVLGFVTYSPIWSNAAIYYGIVDVDLTWLGNMYYLTYFTLAPFFIIPLEWRFDYCMQISSLLTAIGTWIIWVAKDSYLVTLIGYFFVGVSEAMFLAVPVYLSEIWFDVYERTLATCIGSYATLAGIAFGYTYSSLLFYQVTDQEIINYKIDEMNLVIAILNTICVPFSLIFIRHIKQQQSDSIEQESILKQCLRMVSSEENIIDVLSFAFYIGIGWAYITIISIQLFPYGYDQFQVAMTGIVYQVSGIIVGSYASYKIDKDVKQGIQPDYDIYIQITTFLGFICLILQSILIEYFNFWILLIFNACIGIGLNSLYPLAIEAYVEKLYPIRSMLLSTFLISLANMVGFILNYVIVLPVLLDYGLWISVVLLTPFQLYIILFYKTKYKRFEFQN